MLWRDVIAQADVHTQNPPRTKARWPSVTAFLNVLANHYPDLWRRLQKLHEVVGNREVDILEIFARADEEAPRVRVALDAIASDLHEALEAMMDDPRLAGHRLLFAALSAFELGMWVNEQRLMSLRPEDVERRVKALDRRATDAARPGRLETP